MKIVGKLLIALILFSALSMAWSHPVYAEKVEFLEPSVETELGFSFDQDFQKFASKAYRWMFYIAEFLAVLMLAWYGALYVVGGFGDANQASITKAREAIKTIMIGGTIMLLSYLILKTINPKLVEFTLNIPDITTSGGSVTVGGGGDGDTEEPPSASEQEAIDRNTQAGSTTRATQNQLNTLGVAGLTKDIDKMSKNMVATVGKLQSEVESSACGKFCVAVTGVPSENSVEIQRNDTIVDYVKDNGTVDPNNPNLYSITTDTSTWAQWTASHVGLIDATPSSTTYYDITPGQPIKIIN